MKIVFILGLLIVLVDNIECLQCYDCQHVEITACNQTRQCLQDQFFVRHCYTHLFQSCYAHRTSGTTFDLGCKNNQDCSAHSGSSGAIIGRSSESRRQSPCQECCSSDYCNDNLCSHTKPSACVDDETLDCAKLNSLFDICTDVHHAKNVCPKFCGLCRIVDGNWGSWTAWSSCDVSCGNSTQTRTRTCTNPAPEYGGLNCTGSDTETMSCSKPLCPVNGGWSQWSEWGTCSTTCGVGLQRRDRSCSAPFPDRYGEHCFGESRDDRVCVLASCADGGWSSWATWTICTTSCGTGLRSRNRQCNNPTPSPFGKMCEGNSEKSELCSTQACPSSVTDGGWSNWAEWSGCTVTCGSGLRTRQRHCNNPAPSVGGMMCDGAMADFKICNDRSCLPFADCYSIKQSNGSATSGVYSVYLGNIFGIVYVYCDMSTDGGGWTVFQKRMDGHLNFNRTFKEYENGFGSVDSEFWLGLKYVYHMTSTAPSELRLNMITTTGVSGYEEFKHFSLSSAPNYTLHIDSGTGTAGDSTRHGLSYHNGYNFYTKDHAGPQGCGAKHGGGWWYNSCYYVLFNGDYHTLNTLVYYSFQLHAQLSFTRMMFRRMS